MKIALQKDMVVHKNGERQSFSARWFQLAAERNIEAYYVNVLEQDLMARLQGADGFMWRFGYPPYPRLLAKRLLPAIEMGLRIPVFPSFSTAWSFEDKIAQAYQLEAAGLPAAKTYIFWGRESALAFCKDYNYPAVIKLYYGFQSANVAILRSFEDAEKWIGKLFSTGLTSFSDKINLRRSELHHGYIYIQEFLTGNEFDTRVTVIGKRAFAFRRFNRPNDFRASGSGLIDWDVSAIDVRFIELAFQVAEKFGTQSVAIDGLYRNGVPIINELSYTYASWAIRECPGHWKKENGALKWEKGQMRAEDAIFEDFIAEIDSSRRR